MPSSTLRYTGGKTIRAEMNSGRLSGPSQTRARMMKDATGTAFTTATSGASSSRSHRLPAASAARDTAKAHESRKPPKMRAEEFPAARQNAGSGSSSASRRTTPAGEASSSEPWR